MDTGAVELTIYGEVQRVGYRRVVEKAAKRLKITGYVQNLKDGTVRVVAEGPTEQLKQFIESINVKEPPVFVEKMEEKSRRPTGKFRTFSIRPGPLVEELQEGLGAGQEQLSLLRNEIREFRGEFGEAHGGVGEVHGGIWRGCGDI